MKILDADLAPKTMAWKLVRTLLRVEGHKISSVVIDGRITYVITKNK